MKFTRHSPAISIAMILITAHASAVLAAQAQAAAAGSATAQSAYVQPHMQHEPYGSVDVVVPLSSDDKEIQAMKLRNIAHGLKAGDEWQGTFNIKVVLYGKGLTLLMDPDEATKKQLDMLRSRGVQFEVCNNTLAGLGIDFHALYHVTDADIVPSGFAEVAYLQVRRHYAIDPAN
jgi:uncharacterized protein